MITDGNYTHLTHNHPTVFAYVRENEQQKLLVISNFYRTKSVFTCPASMVSLEGEQVIRNYDGEKKANSIIRVRTLRNHRISVKKK